MATANPMSDASIAAWRESLKGTLEAVEATPTSAALDQASLVSYFDLNWLAERSAGSAEERSVVLNMSEPLDSLLDLWRVRTSDRMRQLQELAADPDRLEKGINGATPLPTDHAGRALQTLMQGKPIQVDDDAALEAAFEASTWLRDANIASPDPRTLRRELSRRRKQRRMQDVSARFVGRQDQLDRLNNFADGPREQGGGIPVISVSGIGGIGKSALLASFLRDRIGATEPGAAAPLAFHLDFDRAGATAPLEWTFELNRQLAFLLPVIAGELDQQRKEAQAAVAKRPQQGGGSGEGSQPDGWRTASLESIVASRDDSISGLLELNLRTDVAQRTLLMVFDTVEALQVRSIDGLRHLADWIGSLRYRGGFEDIRVVLSGRVSAKFTDTRFRTLEPILLDELEPVHAVALLERLGVDALRAAPVVEAFGGNPLILRLVAQLAVRAGIDILALAGSPDERTKADKELIQGILYDRVLAHVSSDAVKPLAHPGLALRRVDTGVIRHVLAPICLGRFIEADEAKTLFNLLAAEVWLVEPSPDGGEGVVHRSDLRKLTMLLIARDPDEAARVRHVHLAAIEYYEAEPGRQTSYARDEALYCRFMVPGSSMLPYLDPATAQRARDAIGADLDELPRDTRVALGVALDEGVTAAEARGLPEYLWARYVGKRGRELIDREAYSEALALLDDRPLSGPDRTAAWRMTALDALARWDELFALLPAPSSMGAQKSPADLAAAGLWLMAGLKAGRRESLADEQGAVQAIFATAEQSTQRDLPAMTVTSSYAVRAGWDFLPLRVAKSDLLSDPELAAAWVRNLHAAGREVAFRPVRSQFYPSLEWLRLLRREAGDVAGPALQDLIAAIEATSGPRLVIGRLLGHFSETFEQLWTDAFARNLIPAPAQRLMLGVRSFPEFRTAARVAVLDGCGTPGPLRKLVARLRPMLPMVPHDLTEEGLSRSLSDPRDFVTGFVAYLDRCQLLYRACELITEIAPSAERAAAVQKGMLNWFTPPERAYYVEPDPTPARKGRLWRDPLLDQEHEIPPPPPPPAPAAG